MQGCSGCGFVSIRGIHLVVHASSTAQRALYVHLVILYGVAFSRARAPVTTPMLSDLRNLKLRRSCAFELISEVHEGHR